ncbi:DEAD/DEAH box helicase [Halohasta litorea]|uniref:DEAD/DEAH box helicase n=1 Tax=Halohasta litorea TaxID=869891 RepID=A0ABD6D3S3_9EURY|nr:DEAD/DEAH box helicase [Halohasta litorea]
MNELVDWLRGRPYYDGQIAAHRTLPARGATHADLDLEPRLESALADRGVDSLYNHQADAIEAVREGDNVVIATETASGKSLAYTVPAFERAMDHGGRTLYIGPQNALIADQQESLSDLARGLGFASRVSVDQYTGRLSKTEKRDVRDRRPTVVLSNPDMLHYALLPYADRLWEWFFSSLELVVIDEVHSYRGVFGTQVALVLRRLNRLCEQFDSQPQFVCCSATIGNPVEHASRITGREQGTFRLVDDDTSARGPRHWLLWNPPEYGDGWQDRGSGRRKSSHTEAKQLFVDLVSRGHQTLAFTRARQAAEQYATESSQELRERGESDLAGKVRAYQAALKHDTRREIEADLQSGDLRGIWSTNALELGVDVGGLDAVILDGYPGTRMSASQQAGRAGRGTDPALVAFVGGEDQLDQFLMKHPEEFFEADPERAVSDPENRELLPDHIASAAAENWLSVGDETFFGDAFPEIVSQLEAEGRLERRQTNDGLRWTYSDDGSPQHEMSLRTVGDREVDLLDARSNDVIATLGFDDALRDAHRGAIYHQQGQTYEVSKLNLDRDVAELQPTWADYYTQVLSDKSIVVNQDLTKKPLPYGDASEESSTVHYADVTVTEQITGFQRKDRKTGDVIGEEALDLPETTLRTKALYFTVPPAVESDLRADHTDDEFNGGIHAAEHGMISLFPFMLLCDRGDIGGISTPYHTHTDRSTVFIYDGYPGGVGLTEAGFEIVDDLMARTAELINDCDCADGCPACVQSPQCGNGNEPLTKAPAVRLLETLSQSESDQ